MMRRHLALQLLGCVFATAAALPIAALAQETKPNVVFILADNVGYGDLGAYGGGELRGAPTPRSSGGRSAVSTTSGTFE